MIARNHTAKETIGGLQEMLADVNQHLAAKQKVLGYMRDALLVQLADETLEKYKAAAGQLAESIKTLVALDSLIARIGIRQCSGVFPNHVQTIIPALKGMPHSQYHHSDFLNFNTGAKLPDEERAVIVNALIPKEFEGMD